MSATIKQVNAALQRNGYDGELVRGDGYHYFVGADFDHAFSTSIPVMYTSHLTVEEVLSWANKIREESRDRKPLTDLSIFELNVGSYIH